MKQNTTLFVRVRLPTKAGPAHLELATAVQHPDFIDDMLDVIKSRERTWDTAARVWRVPDRPAVRDWIRTVARLYFEAAYFIEGSVSTSLIDGSRKKQLTLF